MPRFLKNISILALTLGLTACLSSKRPLIHHSEPIKLEGVYTCDKSNFSSLKMSFSQVSITLKTNENTYSVTITDIKEDKKTETKFDFKFAQIHANYYLAQTVLDIPLSVNNAILKPMHVYLFITLTQNGFAYHESYITSPDIKALLNFYKYQDQISNAPLLPIILDKNNVNLNGLKVLMSHRLENIRQVGSCVKS